MRRRRPARPARQAPRAEGPGRSWRAGLFGLVLAALVGGAVWALLGSSFFVVRAVRVTGPGRLPRAQVTAAAAIRIGTPLIRVDTAAVARRVDRITAVESARVTRSWPDAIVISVVPRTAVLAIRARGGYERVDRFGVVLGWTAHRPPGLAVLMSRPGGGSVRAAGTVVRGLPGWLRRQVRAVQAHGRASVVLYLRGGVTVVWGGTGRAAAKSEEVAALLRAGARYCDVSDPVTAVTGAPPQPARGHGASHRS